MTVLPLSRHVLTPSQLGALTRDLLEGSFPLVWVEGEISGVSRPGSGHLYFSLKDARAQLRCAMFRTKSQYLRFAPRDGLQVLLRGRLTVYEPRGDLQLIVDHMEEAGEGALRRALEELKAKLEKEGLFDSKRKRALPRFVHRLGVVTSPSGAAVRDVLHVLQRRFPLLEVEVVPAPVQGAQAAAALVQALRWAGASGRYDALLLTRGGGSLEDLWCFNDEALARVIAASPVLVMSAIGHEIDTTLADLAADLRAPTPSAAAELLVPDRAEILSGLRSQQVRLIEEMGRRLDMASQRADRASLRLQIVRPHARLDRGAARLVELRRRLLDLPRRSLLRQNERLEAMHTHLRIVHPQRLLELRAERLMRADGTLQRGMLELLDRSHARIDSIARAMQAVSPLATLQRGFAILRDDAGRFVRNAADVEPGQRLVATLAGGEVALRVESTDRLDPGVA